MILDAPEYYVEYFNRIGLGNDNIVKLDNFISDNDLEVLLNYLENRTYPPTGHGGYDSIFENDLISESPTLAYPVVSKYIDSTLSYINSIYKNKYGISLKHHDSKNKFQFSRMKPGMNNSAHRDYNLDTSNPFGSPGHNVVAMIYLNGDISGGEIAFPENDITHRPEAGSIITFPANYLHEVLRLKSGTRYAMMLIFTFTQ